MANWKQIPLLTVTALFFISSVHTAAWAELPKNISAAIDSKDYKTALKQLRPLADHGNAEAQYWIGQMYQEGDGVKQDYPEAAKWLQKAAAQDNSDAQVSLGWQYTTGKGVPQDMAKGEQLFLASANQGNHAGIHQLVTLYGMGDEHVEGEYFWSSILANTSAANNKLWAETRDLAAKDLTPEQKAKLDQRVQEWKPTPATSSKP